MQNLPYVNKQAFFKDSPVTDLPARLRFALLCVLFLATALWLEPYLAPLCRGTALQAGTLLGLAGLSPQVHGDLIALSGFTVRIVPECTPLYPVLLYASFVLSRPSSPGRVGAALLLGTVVIGAVNVIRIAVVTAAGNIVSPFAFGLLHVYLGQVVMLLVVLGAALLWLRLEAGAPPVLPFLARAVLWGTLLFIPWLLLNRSYVALLDGLLALLFSMLHPDCRLLTPRPFAIYNHTFAVPLFLALVLAGKRAVSPRRVASVAGGVCLLAGWHALFRVTHVVWTALDIPEIEPLHQAIYLVGQFLLPFLLWLWLDREGRGSGGDRERAREGRLGALLIPALLFVLCTGMAARAESVLLVYSNGRGGFNVAGNNLNRVSEAEIRIDYQSEGEGTPSVSGAGAGAQGSVTVQADTRGSLTIKLKSGKPLSGYALLATAQIRGTVSFASGWLRDGKGTVETPEVTVTNPTEEQLSARISRPQIKGAVGGAAPSRPTVAAVPMVPPAPAPGAEPQKPAKGETSYAVMNRRNSVLELFHSYTGMRTPAALSRLFERGDDMFLQQPPVVLSDGTSPLTLVIRAVGTEVPRFAIANGDCFRVEAGEDGVWRLGIVPARGSLSASVTVLAGEESIEFPLAVAPPLALFDAAGADAGVAEYVETANFLADSLAAPSLPDPSLSPAGPSLPAEPATEPESSHPAEQ